MGRLFGRGGHVWSTLRRKPFPKSSLLLPVNGQGDRLQLPNGNRIAAREDLVCEEDRFLDVRREVEEERRRELNSPESIAAVHESINRKVDAIRLEYERRKNDDAGEP